MQDSESKGTVPIVPTAIAVRGLPFPCRVPWLPIILMAVLGGLGALAAIFLLGKQPQDFLVFLGGLLEDLGRQLRRGGLLVPRLGLEPVAHDLLVE